VKRDVVAEERNDDVCFECKGWKNADRRIVCLFVCCCLSIARNFCVFITFVAEPGLLVCCDRCPKSYHFLCAKLAAAPASFVCPECEKASLHVVAEAPVDAIAETPKKEVETLPTALQEPEPEIVWRTVLQHKSAARSDELSAARNLFVEAKQFRSYEEVSEKKSVLSLLSHVWISWSVCIFVFPHVLKRKRSKRSKDTNEKFRFHQKIKTRNTIDSSLKRHKKIQFHQKSKSAFCRCCFAARRSLRFAASRGSKNKRRNSETQESM